MLTYNRETAILFFTENSPQKTLKVLEQIKKAAPYRLYIVVFGARNKEEEIAIKHVWELLSKINDCSVKKRFIVNENDYTIAFDEAISWFFENESEGIILEDSYIPADSFFGFCSEMLEKYRGDNRIGHISGLNVQNGTKRGDGSYYFSSIFDLCGWATWRRVLKDFNIQYKDLSLFYKLDYLDKLPSYAPFKSYWITALQYNSWAYTYAFHNLIHHRLAIVSNNNMIKISEDFHPFKELNVEESEEIIDPSFMIADASADICSQSLFLNMEIKDDSESFLFIKNRLIENKEVVIPKIIHQIYEDPAGPPEHLKEISQTWKILNPDWEYRFWDKTAIEDFMNSFYPELKNRYNKFPYKVQRWDAIRYLILYHYGGLYADMDYECLEPIDTLIGNSECCMGMEPALNAVKNKKSYIIGNALMAVKPQNYYFKQILDFVFGEYKEHSMHQGTQIMLSTGPFMTTNIYDSLPDKNIVTLLPADLVAPFALEEIRELVTGNVTDEMQKRIDKAYAIHYFLGSWFDQLKSQNNDKS